MSVEYTPEGYTLATWLGAEAAFKGELREPENPGPPPPPHPNEEATQAAISEGHYTAEEVGGG